MKILKEEMQYIDKLIAKTERSIAWAKDKPGVNLVELRNLRFRLKCENKIREVLRERIVDEVRMAASRRRRTPVRSCENCFHHRACLHLISPEDETLIPCDEFLLAGNVAVLPLALGGTVYDKKGVPYNIYKVEGGADPEDFEYSAWNGMLADAGERSHLYFCPGDVGINVFLDNPIGKASLDDSAAKDAVWGGESDE